MMRAGMLVFSPISHSHPMVKYGLPTHFKFWERYDKQILSMCSAVYVVMLPGWDESTGVRAETTYAKELGIPVHHFPEDFALALAKEFTPMEDSPGVTEPDQSI